MTELPIKYFETQSAWEHWLEENHAVSDGIWLKIAKKASEYTSVSYPEVLDIALCFGWIDGQRNKLDDDFFLQKYTPRRKKSIWSQINRDKVNLLIEQGKMRPAGFAEIERAKADGRWDQAYASSKNITVPEDFQAELDKNPDALEFFNQLNKTNRYAFLFRITTAKKVETRQKRIDKFIAMLKAKETI